MYNDIDGFLFGTNDTPEKIEEKLRKHCSK